jgi:hypothetical protein
MMRKIYEEKSDVRIPVGQKELFSLTCLSSYLEWSCVTKEINYGKRNKFVSI